ncbi:g12700 [Coccomyxa viridis]|uniref:G12700 protein n=1 Tax=Coccomyxa viridis TaxID=1274662 RepID=A0ABP1GAZ9_9CHLO
MVAAMDAILTLNVGGKKFTSSRSTVCKDPYSMLARMFNADWHMKNRKDDKGRIFIDRDPQHFGLILNFLRDGTCVLPTDVDARRQILQEAEFYQLESLRDFLMHEDCKELQTAQDLRACIATRLEMDESIKEIVRMLLRCAYGSPLDASSKIPSHSACVEVAVRENAFNPLSSPSTAAQPDERIYVAFQQHITFQGTQHSEQYEAKHESSLIYEGGTLSYDPNVYGGNFQDRYHIKTLQVYEHHCVEQLPGPTTRLRDGALYMANNIEAVQWALELYGFKDVTIKVAADQQTRRAAEVAPNDAQLEELFRTPTPVLCNVRFSINLSL